MARQIERKRASESTGLRDSVQRWKQRVTGVEMRAAGSPGSLREIRGDEWIGVTNTRTLSSADVVPLNRIRAENSPAARGEQKPRSSHAAAFYALPLFPSPLLLSFIPFFSSFASSTTILLYGERGGEFWFDLEIDSCFAIFMARAERVRMLREGLKWNEIVTYVDIKIYRMWVCEYLYLEKIWINFEKSVQEEFRFDFDSFLDPALNFWTCSEVANWINLKIVCICTKSDLDHAYI